MDRKKLFSIHTLISFKALIISSFTGQFLRIIRSYIVAGLLKPVHYGLIQSLNIFLVYAPVLQLGYFQSIERKIPTLLNQGNSNEIRRLLANGVYVLVVYLIVLSAVYFTIFFYADAHQDKASFLIWTGYYTAIFFFPLNWYFEIIYITFGRIERLAKLHLYSNFLFFALLLLPYYFDYTGQVLSIGISFLFLFTLLFKSIKLRFIKGVFSYQIIKNNIKDGFPLMVNQYLFILIISLDRLYMATFRSPESFAWYAIAIALFKMGQMIPDNLNLILYRFLNFNIKNENSNKVIESHFMTNIVQLLLFIATICIMLIVPNFIETLLPKYLLAIPQIYVLAFAMPFTGPSILMLHRLYSEYKQRDAIKILLTCLLIFVLALSVTHYYNLADVYVGASLCLTQIVMFIFLKRHLYKMDKLSSTRVKFNQITFKTLFIILLTGTALVLTKHLFNFSFIGNSILLLVFLSASFGLIRSYLTNSKKLLLHLNG